MSTSDIVNDILSHHGVKGQRWGLRRKSTVGAQEVVISDKRKKIKTSGGGGHSAHPDAVRARTVGQIGKKSGPKALSNQDLHTYTTRINMEQSFKRVQYSQKNAGARFVATILGQTGKTQATNVANDVAAQQIKRHLGKRLLSGATTAAAVAV